MSELPLKEAIKILTQEKKKVELKLAKAYDSFCLYPNERDQNDWDHFSALDSAFEMGISALVELNNKKSSDTINRQDAIDAVTHITSSMSVCVNADECHGMKRMQRQAVIELANLPSAKPESCEGCIQYGLWENEIEYGYSSPCTRCKRRANDNYER